LKNTNFIHYTNATRISELLQNGFKGRICGYLEKDDILKDTNLTELANFLEEDFIDTIQSNINKSNGTRKSSMISKCKIADLQKIAFEHKKGNPIDSRALNLLEELKKNKKLKEYVAFCNMDNLVKALQDDMGQNNEHLFAPLKIVIPIEYYSNNSNLDISEIDPWNYSGKMAAYGPKAGKWDLKESRIYVPRNERLTKEMFKIRIPFGAVNKNNVSTYIESLKNVPSAYFDTGDQYTRLLINLFRKNGGKIIENIDNIPGNSHSDPINHNHNTTGTSKESQGLFEKIIKFGDKVKKWCKNNPTKTALITIPIITGSILAGNKILKGKNNNSKNNNNDDNIKK
jgi:hypothetical protein